MHAQPVSQYGNENYANEFGDYGLVNHYAVEHTPYGSVGMHKPVARKKRVNLLAVVASLILPWLMFVCVFQIMSFKIHYKHPTIGNIVFAVGLLLVLIPVVLAYVTYQKKQKGFDRDPSWFVFNALALLLALIIGHIFGSLNFWKHMQAVYDIENLNSYPSVNPARENGGQLMDAGRVAFTDGTRLDRDKVMGFRNYDQYCVVPIVHGNHTMENYDFWAVGLNCCGDSATEFRCGEFNNHHAQSGLRLMVDEQRPFYRLAVKQAEALYGIKANHPLFFYWMQDPNVELNSHNNDGHTQFMSMMLYYFCFNAFCVVGGVLTFSKM